jgi:hypothetical protein
LAGHCPKCHRGQVLSGETRMRNSGQSYTEYSIILAVTLGVAFGVASAFTYLDLLHDNFFAYYASLVNFLNLPFF